MQKVPANAECLSAFRPRFTRALYNTEVNVTGKHLSGLLLFKTMPDSSTRIVFSNEMGFKYFDFEFSAAGDFKVYYILPAMDKKAVRTTLRKDFELLLMYHLDSSQAFGLRDGDRYYHGFRQTKGNYYYITDPACTRLVGMERASQRKPVVQAIARNFSGGMPDTVGFTHTKFEFTIGLKKITP